MVLGIDPWGVVEALGHGVTRFALGERVAVRLSHRGGGYAEFVIADEARAYPIPGALSFAEATVVTRLFLAAFNLANAAVIREGEWMLVMGAQPPALAHAHGCLLESTVRRAQRRRVCALAVAPWCSGSTADFESVNPGSNPGGAARRYGTIIAA